MKKSIKELMNYRVEATDGIKGSVEDFLFDEETWRIRYLEVDLGNLFPGKKVVISKTFLEEPDWLQGLFPVQLTKKEIEKSPLAEKHLPISRKYEEELNKVFDLNDYWEETYPFADGSAFIPPRPKRMPSNKVDEKQLKTHLRSFNEIIGYQIKASDGKLGHIEDLIIDKNWQIIYAVVDTVNWMPWSKEVLISVDQMKEISYLDEEINIDLHTQTIKNAPEFSLSEFLNKNYEKDLREYYKKAE